MRTKYPFKKLENGNIRTCEVRLSFPEVFHAKAMEEGKKPKFSTAVLIPKGADLTVLKQAMAAAAKEKWGDKVPKGLRTHLRNQGDKEFEGYEDGAFYFNCSTERRPPVVDRKRQPIVDEDAVYPGVWALVTIRVYAYGPKPGEKFAPGIGFGLQSVQIIKDGERLGGGVSDPNEDFEVLEDLDEGDSADAIFGADGDDDVDPFA